MRSVGWWSTALLLGLTAVACGGGGKTSSGTTTTTSSASTSNSNPAAATSSVAGGGAILDPCKVITTDEVAAVLGGTVTNAPSGPYDCEFKSSSNKAILVSAAVSRQGFDTASQAFQGTAVSGIGDAAYIAPSKNIVSFIKGQNVISIKAGFSLASPDAANQIEDLAKKAAARA